VSLAHPLYGEVLRDRMSALTRRRLLTELADRLESAGAKRREDAIRIAAARLETQGSADPELLIRAARLARYALDFHQVERFARAAVVDGMTPESGLLLGEALTNSADYAEAEAVLSAAEQRAADDDPLLVHIVEIRSRNLMLSELDVDAARTLNNVVRDRLLETNRAAAIELTINEGLLLAYAGRPIEAIEEHRDAVPMCKQLLRGECYFLRVSGDSMRDDHILDGDLVLVRRQPSVERGEIAVALLPDGTATLKRVYRERGRFRLQPANEAHQPIYVRSLDVQGKVVSVLRRFT
jgi:SOS-response transcriptional repressor LexA